MRQGRGQKLLYTIQDELARLTKEVDMIEEKCNARGPVFPRCSSALGYSTETGFDVDVPLGDPLLGNNCNSSAADEMHLPLSEHKVSGSRIPRHVQPARPMSAAGVPPPRALPRPRVARREITIPAGSHLPRPAPFQSGKGPDIARSMHSSVSSLTSMDGGKMPKPPKSREHSLSFDSTRVPKFGMPGKRTDVPRNKFPKPVKTRCSSPASRIGAPGRPKCSSALGYVENIPSTAETPSPLRKSKSGTAAHVGTNMPPSCVPSYARKPRYRPMSPSLKKTMEAFDIGCL